jgi:hypothetical protein
VAGSSDSADLKTWREGCAGVYFHKAVRLSQAPLYVRRFRRRLRVIEFSEHSSQSRETAVLSFTPERTDAMQRRDFLKFAVGFVAGGAVLAASAEAAPLPPVSQPSMPLSGGASVEPAVISQDDVDHIKPEQVRWHRRWHRHWHRRWYHRRWGWRRRHWGWRRHHWRRHRHW